MTQPVTLHLHHAAQSRSFRVLWLLEELGLPYTLSHYGFTDGSLRQPEFMARSPAGKVPALEAGGVTLFESGAIVQWLTETEGRLAPRPGEAGRADFLQWLHFAETQAICIQNLNIQHVFIRPETARSVTAIKLETRRLMLAAAALEGRLARGPYLLGETFSAADCMFGFNVPAMGRFLRLDPYPATRDWWARMQQRPACQRALVAAGPGYWDRDFYEVPDG